MPIEDTDFPNSFGRPQFVRQEVYQNTPICSPKKQNTKTRKYLAFFNKAATNTLPTSGSEARFRLLATQPLPGSAGIYPL